MKVLRFGVSDDSHGDLPREGRSWHLAALKLEEETGEPWETFIRRSWPTSSWAEEVERDIRECSPDLVVLCCAAFWVSYPSWPLRLHRSRWPGSQQLARVGFWAAAKPALANRAVFHAGRRLLTRNTTTEFFFEPETALDRVERVVRAVLRHENIALAVRGPLPLRISGSESFRQLCERRRAALDSGLSELCKSLHVEYLGFGANDCHPEDELLGDRIHVNAKGHVRRAEDEFSVMSRAWKAHIRDSGNQ